MLTLIKTWLIYLLYYSGVAALFGMDTHDRIFCVGYHSISSSKNAKEFSQHLYENISTSVEDFEMQIAYMKKKGHTFMRLSDLQKPETRKFSKPTVIFFDDGYKDNLVNALPILQKYNAPATVFVTTGLIERTHFLWTLAVRACLFEHNVEPNNIEQKIAELKKLGMKDRDAKLTKI